MARPESGSGVAVEVHEEQHVVHGTPCGTWQTNIYSGPCFGAVVMDVAAFAVT